MPVPDFSPGEVLTAAAMDSIGFWLVKSQTIGTSVSSVDITSCFNSSYDNYKISFSGVACSANMSIVFTLLSGTTPVTANWLGTEYFTSVGATTMTGQLSNGAGAGTFCSAGTVTSGVSSVMEIQSPFLAQQTRFQASFGDSAFFRSGFGLHTLATSYDGFRITASSGSMTGGTISVFGYRK
jgi:hypothetical protein